MNNAHNICFMAFNCDKNPVNLKKKKKIPKTADVVTKKTLFQVLSFMSWLRMIPPHQDVVSYEFLKLYVFLSMFHSLFIVSMLYSSFSVLCFSTNMGKFVVNLTSNLSCFFHKHEKICCKSDSTSFFFSICSLFL